MFLYSTVFLFLYCFVLFCLYFVVTFALLGFKQWRIQEFQNRGSGPGTIEFLGSEICFDAPLTHTLCFVVRVENKLHFVKYSRIIQSKFTKTTPPQKKIKQGCARPARRCWIRLWVSRWIKIDQDYLIGLCTFLSFYETKSNINFKNVYSFQYLNFLLVKVIYLVGESFIFHHFPSVLLGKAVTTLTDVIHPRNLQ